MQPAVGKGRPVGIRPVPVAGRDVRSLDPEFTDLADGGVGPVGQNDPHFGMQDRFAGRPGLARGVLASSVSTAGLVSVIP